MASISELIAASKDIGEQQKQAMQTPASSFAMGAAESLQPGYRDEQVMKKMALASKLIEFSEKASMARIQKAKEQAFNEQMKEFMNTTSAKPEDALESGKTKQTKIAQINSVYKKKFEIGQKDYNITFEERDSGKGGKGDGSGHTAMKTAWDVAKQMAIPEERRLAGEEDSKYTAKYDPAYYTPKVETVRKFMPLAEGYILGGSKEPIDQYIAGKEQEERKQIDPFGRFKDLPMDELRKKSKKK